MEVVFVNTIVQRDLSGTVGHQFRSPLLAYALACLILLTAAVGQSQSQDEASAEEYRAKSALLFAFAKFVQWPDAAFAQDTSPIVFAVIGNHDMFSALHVLTDKKIHGRPLEVIELDDPGSSDIYQLLYCDRGIIEQFEQEHPERLAQNHVLTIGEDEGFAEAGGILRLMLIDEHLGFVINATAVQRAKLSLGSSLYNLAHAVLEESY